MAYGLGAVILIFAFIHWMIRERHLAASVGSNVPISNTGTSVDNPDPNISTAEYQELARAYLAALKANPGLRDLNKRLSEQLHAAIAAGQPPSEDLRKTEVAYQLALHAAMLKTDPNIGKIVDKMGSKQAQ